MSHYFNDGSEDKEWKNECCLNFRSERKEGAKMCYYETEWPFIENFPLFRTIWLYIGTPPINLALIYVTR